MSLGFLPLFSAEAGERLVMPFDCGVVVGRRKELPNPRRPRRANCHRVLSGFERRLPHGDGAQVHHIL
jgi:hypothetical protein